MSQMRQVTATQQRGHNRCTCGHLDAHHRLWDKPGTQSCRLDCTCEQFQLKRICHACGGDGFGTVMSYPCPVCKGTGEENP